MEKPIIDYMNFKHDSEDFAESIGLSEEERDEVCIKMAAITKDYFERDLSQSQIAESLAQTMNIKELVFMATMHMKDVLDKFIELKPEVTLMAGLKARMKEAGIPFPETTAENLDFVRGIFGKYKDAIKDGTFEKKEEIVKPTQPFIK
jgi:hypothetical protein